MAGRRNRSATREKRGVVRNSRNAFRADRARGPPEQDQASSDPSRSHGGVEPADVGSLAETLGRRNDEHRLESRDRSRAAEERRGQRAKHRIAGDDREGSHAVARMGGGPFRGANAK